VQSIGFDRVACLRRELNGKCQENDRLGTRQQGARGVSCRTRPGLAVGVSDLALRWMYSCQCLNQAK
jgi:hypothetical protein